MITTKFKSFFNKIFDPVGSLFVMLHVTPNQITVSGFFFVVLTCLYYLAERNIAIFTFGVIFFGLFDAVDGVVARKTGRVSRFGSYLDAMCDRLVESCIALTAAIVTGEWVLTFVMMVGAMCVSYAKARAAIEVPVTNTEWPDLMERTERGTIFLIGFLTFEWLHTVFFGKSIFFWTLIVLNVGIYITLTQRILRAKRLIESRSGKI